ncbi:MAG: hypothetical protein HYT15_02295 [Candidatus Magasanikbacteria bacterium]|nr:hypothetical protein [Candidatus Magasanikbacteria bacterium]
MSLLKRWIKKWKFILVDLVSFVGIFWLFVEIASYSTAGSADVYLKKVDVFAFVFIIILLFAIVKNKPKSHFGYHLRGKDNFLEIRVGDAFENKGALVVPVNDQFDMSLGGNVQKANSIQNQVIQKFYNGKTEHLNTDISAKLSIGTNHDVGKTIEVEQNGKKFYLVVNSVKNGNNRVKSEIDDFIQALNGLWSYVALESAKDSAVTIPLINTQHGRDSYLSRTGSIKEIIASYVETSKTLNICEKLIISIYPVDLKKGNIDLDELEDYLRYSCRYYRQLTIQEKTEDPNHASKIIRIDS